MPFEDIKVWQCGPQYLSHVKRYKMFKTGKEKDQNEIDYLLVLCFDFVNS